MPCSPISTNSSMSTPATPISIHCGGKIARSSVPGARATTSVPGAPTTTDRIANATGATAVGAPSMTSRTRCWPRASGRCRTGFSRPFCCACRVHLVASRRSWASISAPAIAGAGGCAMRPCPTRWIANWGARSKRMNSITPPARRAKHNTAGKSPWDAGRGVAARSASLAGATMTKTGRRSSRGSAARGLSWCRPCKDFTVTTVQKAADLAVQAGSRLYTDSASSYRALKGYVHEFVNHTQKEYARGEVHENRAECLFSLLKPYLRVFRGISKSNLPGYVGFFQFLRNFRQQNAFEQAEMILHAALDPAIASRARKGEFVTCFDHFDLLQTAIN